MMDNSIENPYLPNGPQGRGETAASRPNDGPGLADFLPDVSAGYTAYAGTTLETALGAPDAIAVEDALKTVHDPEIPVNIYDLGLIYDINRQQNGDVHITMSLTAPGCPVAGEMPGQVAAAVAALDDVGKVAVELVWEPAWSPERMSEDAKMALDLGF
jgi:FeS assembly SUF system protein